MGAARVVRAKRPRRARVGSWNCILVKEGFVGWVTGFE